MAIDNTTIADRIVAHYYDAEQNAWRIGCNKIIALGMYRAITLVDLRDARETIETAIAKARHMAIRTAVIDDLICRLEETRWHVCCRDKVRTDEEEYLKFKNLVELMEHFSSKV